MKKITFIYVATCPYCANARRAMAELKEEDPACRQVPFEAIDEAAEPDKAAVYGDSYYYVPTFFVDGKKLYEASPDDTYEIIRDHVKEVFRAAMQD